MATIIKHFTTILEVWMAPSMEDDPTGWKKPLNEHIKVGNEADREKVQMHSFKVKAFIAFLHPLSYSE